MQVILTKYIPKLGKKNEVVKVRNGFANNYLFPQGLAIMATEASKKMQAENEKQRAHKQEQLLEQAQANVKKLQVAKIEIAAEAEKERIFGNITELQIARAMEKVGFHIHPKQIIIKEPIKELGTHNILLHLHEKVEFELSITVINKS